MICNTNIITFKIHKGILKIPFACYNKSLAIDNETKLFAISKTNISNSCSELIISSIHPAKWNNIYSIEIIAESRIELIKDVKQLFEKARINILQEDIFATKFQGKHQFRMLLDMSHPVIEQNLDNEAKIDEFLEAEILEELRKINSHKTKTDCKQIKNKNVVVKCEKNVFLSTNCPKNDHENKIKDDRKALFSSEQYQALAVTKNSLLISEDLLIDLNLQSKKEMQGMIVSDTEEEFFKIRFFNEEQKLLKLDITYVANPEATFEFSDYVSWRGNIISYHNSLLDNKGRNHWNAIIEIMANIDLDSEFLKKLNWEEFAKHKKRTIKIEEIRAQYTKNLRPRRKSVSEYKKDIIYLSVIIVILATVGVYMKWLTISSLKNIAISMFTGISVIYYLKVAIEVLKMIFNKIKNIVN